MGHLDYHKIIPKDVSEYCHNYSSQETKVAKKIHKSYKNHRKKHMIIGRLVGNIIRMLITAKKDPLNVLEIGAFVGYSTAIIASSLPKHSTFWSFEKDYSYYIEAKNNLSDIENNINLNLVNGDGADWLQQNNNHNFDTIFIDANKQSYVNKHNLIIEKLNEEGYLIVDNALAQKGALDPSKSWEMLTHKFNVKINKDDRLNNIILPVRDGLLVAYKKLK